MRALSMAEDSTSKGLYSTYRNYYVNQSILSQVADLPDQFPRSPLIKSKASPLMILYPSPLVFCALHSRGFAQQLCYTTPVG